ncbi:restriction endonuclease, partial [Halobacteriales archaeon QH_9_66_26]
MADASVLHDSLHAIAERADGDMSERDVENLFLERGFYDALDYEGTGTDLRSEFTLPDERRPDYITLDTNEAVTAVYEFKTTGRDLAPHESQLFGYMNHLRAEYGVLTNGDQLQLYRRGDDDPTLVVSMESVTESDARDLVSALRKREFDLTDPAEVEAFLADLDPVPLDERAELGQEHFFDTFRLEDGSPFADLVTGMMDLLGELRDERDATFVTGAYDFWEATYASEPEDVPASWDPFIDDGGSLRDFMFCLESAHALLARLLLAKATEDHDFFAGTGYDGMAEYFRGLQGFGETINLDAFPVAADNLIDDMQEQLVEGLFQDDIFVWWTDGYAEQLDRGHGTGASQFADVARGTGDVERISEPTRDRFSRAVAEVFVNVLRFDFADVEGDLLGDLYQRYFDPETRKALGEFYTPGPVIDYIMDGVGYDRGVANDRLIDPACGSGTFLVEAVERYLRDVERYEDDPDWETHLRDLCTRPRIVGLDVHPFAVLMAQIRFVVAILPAYREAKTANPSFTLRRLPIYRTDTLRNERELTGADLGDDGSRQVTLDALTEDDQDVRIPVPLPIEADADEPAETEDGFLVRRVRMPLFDTIRLETGVANFGEYFAALQGVLDTVKDHMALVEEFSGEFDWRYRSGLEERINRYTTQDYSGTEEFFEEYVNDMLETVRYLRDEHDDGRLFKMFEDTVLALVVKNYLEYDYVVGNPPYVNIKNIPDRSQEVYRELYDSAYGRFDLYVLFIERGLDLLNENEELGYITSNKFARSKYGQEIRRIISAEYSLAKYVDFGDTGVFEDATNYPCIFFVDGDRRRENIPYAKIHLPMENVLETVEENIGDTDVMSESFETSTFPSSELDEEIWAFTPKPVRNLVDKLDRRANETVEDICHGVRQGISSGGDEAFVVSQNYAEENELEEELLYSIIRGKFTRRWQAEWDGDVAIYPYDENGDYTGVSEYPNIKSHLDEHEETLQSRYCVETGGKGLYEYDGPRPKSVFEGDFRIGVPDMATENHFAYTDGYDCFKNTAYVLTFSDSQRYSEKELLGLLNSSVAEFVIKQMSPFLNDRYYRY